MEPIVSKEQIAQLLRSASGDFFAAVVQLNDCDIVGGERQTLEDVVVATESWRSEPFRVKIGSFQGPRPLRLTPLFLSESGLKQETLDRLAAAFIRVESSPRTAPISKSAEAFIAQLEKQGASNQLLVILRKAFPS